MAIEILLSVIIMLGLLIYIMIDKYRKQLKRANGWKADYIVCKQLLDERNSKFKTLQRYCEENCD
mgnify:FL=1